MANVTKLKIGSNTYDVKDSVARANEAADYSSTSVYSVGDYCLYNGVLYRCNTAIATGGESWTAAHWTAVKLAPEISDLNNTLNQNDILETLRADDIPGTTQSIIFDQQTGNISQTTHTANNTVVRTDVFTFGIGTITEVRTLSTGQSLTIVTDTTTLETTITYSDAA